ncbi:hypothetical protein BDR06DRAFT_1005248 [Suillus hirtellus]|nr:hypothetical protein BDR06DRAFT_1005248 [Suillus hirtellus]
MEQWKRILGPALLNSTSSELDFIQAFHQLRVAAPPNFVRSSRLKEISMEELHSSGSSLHGLCSLDLDTLHLAQKEHTWQWARDTLSHHGPVLNGTSWTPEAIGCLSAMPVRIYDEFNVVEYLKSAFMGLVGCGATCLFQISCRPGDDPLGFPSSLKGCAIQTKSMSGPSGRLDAEFIWDFKTCVTVEVKTQKATSVNNATADMLQKLGDCWSEWSPTMHVDQLVHLAPAYQILVQIQQEKKWKTEASTTGSSQLEEVTGGTWQSKVLGTIYQV